MHHLMQTRCVVVTEYSLQHLSSFLLPMRHSAKPSGHHPVSSSDPQIKGKKKYDGKEDIDSSARLPDCPGLQLSSGFHGSKAAILSSCGRVYDRIKSL